MSTVETNDSGMVFDSCEALYVFANAGGGVSIRQYSTDIQADVVVAIPTHHIEKTISALREAKHEAIDLKDA